MRYTSNIGQMKWYHIVLSYDPWNFFLCELLYVLQKTLFTLWNLKLVLIIKRFSIICFKKDVNIIRYIFTE